MNIMRKLVSFMVCVCLSFQAMPIFASVAVESEVSSKHVLTDSEMEALVGASGSVDATLADYTVAGTSATAVFANRTTLTMAYSLDVVDSGGNVVETLAEGFINPQTAKLVTGTPTVPNSKQIQARIWNQGVLGLQSKDSSWAQ